MKNISAIYLFLLLLITAMSTGTIRAQGGYTLYPPTGLNGIGIEDACYLNWQKPQDTGGNTPAGLLGYYLYRNGVAVHFIGDPDSLLCYDYLEDPGIYTYALSAYYDLTSYGYPGTYGQSALDGPVIVDILSSEILPLLESWNSGNFDYNRWRFVSAQANWTVPYDMGNPGPAAAFNGTPMLTDYNYLLKSRLFNAKIFVCSRFYLEFDYKLEDLAAGGTESLSAEYYFDSLWRPIATYTNKGTTEWIHIKLELENLEGKEFKVGFRASGSLSTNLNKWLIDNIYVYPFCEDPINPHASVNGSMITLSWQVPCGADSGIAGYNIYRTDTTGLPPYVKVNTTPVTDTSYQDVFPVIVTPGMFRYIVSTFYWDPISQLGNCESDGDTLTVELPVGLPNLQKNPLVVSPNPANDFVNVKSDIPVALCRIYNLTGEMVYSFAPGRKTSFTIPVSGLPAGIYFLKITSSDNVARTLKVIKK